MDKKLKIFYLLSEAGRKDSLKKGGDGRRLQEVETDLTPELIDLESVKVDDYGNATLYVGHEGRGEYPVLMDYEIVEGDDPTKLTLNQLDYVTESKDVYYLPRIKNIEKKILFDKVMDAESLIEWEKQRLANLAQRKAEVTKQLEDMKQAYLEKAKAVREEKIREENDRKAREQAEKAAKEAEKKKWEQEKIEWINKYGSQYLKDCLALGYDCQREYVIERAKAEFPNFIVDYDNNAAWEERISPSPEALNEVKELIAKGLKAQIVWLTDKPKAERDDDDDYYDEFEACEAIVIRDYLGQYDLVKY